MHLNSSSLQLILSQRRAAAMRGARAETRTTLPRTETPGAGADGRLRGFWARAGVGSEHDETPAATSRRGLVSVEA